MKSSLDIIKELISKQDLLSHSFHLYNHPPIVNWRQKNPDIFSRIDNIQTGIKLSKKKKLISISGEEFVQLKSVSHFSGEEAPLVSIASMIFSSKGEVSHLPLMNIHLDLDISLSDLHFAISKIAKNEFYLVKTDRYFHVYSLGLMTSEEWRLWNLRFLMADFLVSPRYIGYSLHDNFNSLRINSANEIKTCVPHLINPEERANALDYEEVKRFVVKKHAYHFTKRGAPYIFHLLDVERYATLIAHECNISKYDIDHIRCASLLHDSIEDTETDFEDIENLVGEDVSIMVSQLSNDKRLRKPLRDQLFLSQIKKAPINVQVIKLADIYSNLLSIHLDKSRNTKNGIQFAAKAFTFLEVLKEKLGGTRIFGDCIKLCNELIGTNDIR